MVNVVFVAQRQVRTPMGAAQSMVCLSTEGGTPL
jgi:hypothetical protein